MLALTVVESALTVDSATPPSCTSVRIDRGCSAAAPAPGAYSRRDLYPTSTPSTRHILKRTRNTLSPPSRRSIPLDAVEGKAVGLSVLLVSTSVEVCVARERARGLETRRSRRLACRSLSHAARRCQRCAPRSLLLHLAAKCFLLFAPREGPRFAGGLARCGGELYCLHSFEF